jgi:hypothetical protein
VAETPRFDGRGDRKKPTWVRFKIGPWGAAVSSTAAAS